MSFSSQSGRRHGDGVTDLSYVYAAVREVAVALKDFTVVVTKSTVPVGTGDEVERIIRELRPQLDVAVASNPEFLREGAAIYDFKHPDRIIVGTEDGRAAEVMAELYRPLYLNAAPVLNTDRRTAELIKYASNALLATKITFMNEIADLCEKVGADVQSVARGVGLDKRIGSKFLHAGPGFGGSCFPKDTLALTKTGQDHDAPLRIVEAVVAVNDQRKRAMARRVATALGGEVRTLRPSKSSKIAERSLPFGLDQGSRRRRSRVCPHATLLSKRAERPTAFWWQVTPQKTWSIGCCARESGDAIRRSRLGN